MTRPRGRAPKGIWAPALGSRSSSEVPRGTSSTVNTPEIISSSTLWLPRGN
jgi:hypothetical protein